MQPNGEAQRADFAAREESPYAGKKAKPSGKPAPTRKKKRFRFWFRISLPFLCAIALFAGMAIGYVRLGHASASDIWKWQTWKHAFDLIFAS